MFVRRVEPRLRRALVSARGPLLGRDATAEALAYAWEHWDVVAAMTNPVGYLFRVGQSRTRPRKTPPMFVEGFTELPEIEPRLIDAVAALSESQRVAVCLVHGFGWSHREVGDLLGIAASTVSSHVARGLARLRSALGEATDA